MKNLYIPKEVIEYLEATVKSVQPKPGQTHDEIMYHAGRRQVADHLRHLHDNYNEANS